MRWKVFRWMKRLFRHSSNLRKLSSRQKFHNEHACVFSAHYASKNADWNQQQLTDGGILANRNSANHPYCFLSNQKKVQILAFFTCDPTKKCIMPSSRERLKGIIGRGHDLRLVKTLTFKLDVLAEALVDTLRHTSADAKATTLPDRGWNTLVDSKTLGETLANVEVVALVDTLGWQAGRDININIHRKY